MRRVGILAAVILAGCAHAASGQDSLDPSQGDIPPGMGTLSQDDIALTMRQEELEIRVVPLDERLIWLLTPDTYRSLRDVARIRAALIDSVSRQNGVSLPGILLVTFFGRRQGARFDPQNLNLQVRNQLFRPIGQVAYSTNFNSQQLDQRQQATGLILFEKPIPVFEPFVVSYGAASDSWEGKLNKIQRERSRVLGRVRADSSRVPPDTTSHR
jgi:hypothetical protein